MKLSLISRRGRRLPAPAIVGMFVGLLSGCALKSKPALEPITVTSVPAGAQAIVLGRAYMTPATVNVPRDKPLTICVAAPGFAAKTIYDDTMEHWKYFNDCYLGETDCRGDMKLPTTTHIMTDVKVRLHPCPPSSGVCAKCSG